MGLSFLDRISVRAKLWLLTGILTLIASPLWSAGYWMTQRLNAQSHEMAETLIWVGEAGDLARLAQNEFKKQVQE